MYSNDSIISLFQHRFSKYFILGLSLLTTGLCQASSSFFVAPSGTGDCSQPSPCGLQTALDQARNSDTIYLSQGTYTHSGEVVVAIEHSVSLLGGWDNTSANPVIRDPATHVSILDGENQRRGITIAANIHPTIDGLTITRGNATGLGGGFVSSDAGGGIYSVDASPVITNNILTDNVATTQSDARGMGGAVYLQSASGFATVGHNHFLNNTAGIAIHLGDGGGLFLSSPGTIHDNEFRNNEGCRNCSGQGGAINVGWTEAQPLITRNLIHDNQANKGGGIDLVWSAAQVIGNDLVSNDAISGSGIYAYYDKGSTISKNIMLANQNSSLWITITFPDKGKTVVSNNIIANSPQGVFAYSDWHIAAVDLIHNTLANNTEGINVGRNMTATLINNIIFDHDKGVTLSTAEGAAIISDNTLFWQNTDDGFRGNSAVDGDPDFVNSANDDYHLGSSSAAIDAGIDSTITTDMDGTPRPNGIAPDIGADEYTATPFSCSGDNVTVNYDFGQIIPVVCTATGSITTLDKVNILPGADVSFRAGSKIMLLRGFAVKRYAVFHASISP
jgi:hypothetical protein